jgi:hypothetical protein
MPPSVVKGKAEPIQTYRVESAAKDRRRAEPVAGPS